MKILLCLFLTLFVQSAVFANNIIDIATDAKESVIERHFYNFGDVSINLPQTVSYRIKNTGNTNLTFKNSEIYGMDFSARHNCNKELVPGDKCVFIIRFAPFFEGIRSGKFLIEFNEDYAIQVDLLGRAISHN